MTESTKIAKVPVEGSEISQRDLGKEISIILDCNGKHTPKNEVICYTGLTRSVMCSKTYGRHEEVNGIHSIKTHKTKQVNVKCVNLKKEPFKDVLEFFTYMVENRGYSWIRQ